MDTARHHNSLPACVLPRRRFIRWFLAALFLITLGCVLLRFYVVHYPNWSLLLVDLEFYGQMMLLVFGPLLIPVCTKRGSMLQLLGLIGALLLSFVICIVNWEPYVPCDPELKRLANGMLVALIAVPLILYIYIPVFWLHLLLCFVENCNQSK